MDYYWKSESPKKLRELINAESIESGDYSLSLTITYIKNGNSHVTEPIFITVDDFTEHFSSTVSKNVRDIDTVSNIQATLSRKNISSGFEEIITICNPPFMVGKKIL